MKFSENEILIACALRFDGYKYWQKRCIDYGVNSSNFIPLTEKVIETREFHQEQLDNLTTFFIMQRYLFKWGGERLTDFSDEHIVFRALFLHLYREEIPEAYRFSSYYQDWERNFKPRQEELAAKIRNTFRRIGKGPKVI